MSHGGTEEKIWTSRQFANAMRRAGWENKGQGYYVHKKTHATFYAWTWTKRRQEKYGHGEAWYEFALMRQIPTEAPF